MRRRIKKAQPARGLNAGCAVAPRSSARSRNEIYAGVRRCGIQASRAPSGVLAPHIGNYRPTASPRFVWPRRFLSGSCLGFRRPAESGSTGRLAHGLAVAIAGVDDVFAGTHALRFGPTGFPAPGDSAQMQADPERTNPHRDRRRIRTAGRGRRRDRRPDLPLSRRQPDRRHVRRDRRGDGRGAAPGRLRSRPARSQPAGRGRTVDLPTPAARKLDPYRHRHGPERGRRQDRRAGTGRG